MNIKLFENDPAIAAPTFSGVMVAFRTDSAMPEDPRAAGPGALRKIFRSVVNEAEDFIFLELIERVSEPVVSIDLFYLRLTKDLPESTLPHFWKLKKRKHWAGRLKKEM